VDLEKGPNIQPLPNLDPLPDRLEAPVLLKVGDDISTDEIMPAGTRVLPFRSNIPEISKFVYEQVDPANYERALKNREGGSLIVGGKNYGQGSSREHAALAPRYLGVRVILAKGFARIHFQNLANFGILPLAFASPEDYDRISLDDVLIIDNLREALLKGKEIMIRNKTNGQSYGTVHSLYPRQVEMVLEGGLVNVVRKETQ